MKNLTFSNIFDAITDNPAEAADLKFRADMMLVLRRIFETQGLSQAQIGKVLDVPQPRVSELMRGKIDKVSSDKLIGYLASAGFRFQPTYVAPGRGKQQSVKCTVIAQAAQESPRA